MRICIVTRMDYNNYGNRLQNYALTKLLQNEGWECCSGLQVRSKEDWEANSTQFIKLLKQFMPFWMFRIKTERELAIKEKKANKRRKAFISFTDKYIYTLPPLIVRNEKDLTKKMQQYNFDYYIVGSDQVWNPTFSGRNYEFLTFAPKDKRLSFSASFGVDDIPEEQKKRYADALKSMRYISVREEQGIRIVRSLSGRTDVELTLDPTLLLEIEIWEKLIKDTNMNKPQHYIATYYLGEFPNEVKEFAEKHNLPLLMLNSKKSQELFSLGPEGFLSVLHDADYVFTDSFHALAFSLIFHRNFYVYKRKETGHENMFSRLQNLLALFDLSDRIIEDEEIPDKCIIDEPKWKEIDDYLLLERKKSISRLKNIMIMGT